jgi:hypothetical protein
LKYVAELVSLSLLLDTLSDDSSELMLEGAIVLSRRLNSNTAWDQEISRVSALNLYGIAYVSKREKIFS